MYLKDKMAAWIPSKKCITVMFRRRENPLIHLIVRN